MNQFEQHIKSSLESYDPGFNSADWKDMNKRLDSLNAGKTTSTVAKGLLIAASVLATAGLVYYFSTNTTSTTATQQTVADNHIASANKSIVVISKGLFVGALLSKAWFFLR